MGHTIMKYIFSFFLSKTIEELWIYNKIYIGKIMNIVTNKINEKLPRIIDFEKY